jgi:hypothetical protein
MSTIDQSAHATWLAKIDRAALAFRAETEREVERAQADAASRGSGGTGAERAGSRNA